MNGFLRDGRPISWVGWLSLVLLQNSCDRGTLPLEGPSPAVVVGLRLYTRLPDPNSDSLVFGERYLVKTVGDTVWAQVVVPGAMADSLLLEWGDGTRRQVVPGQILTHAYVDSGMHVPRLKGWAWNTSVEDSVRVFVTDRTPTVVLDRPSSGTWLLQSDTLRVGWRAKDDGRLVLAGYSCFESPRLWKTVAPEGAAVCVYPPSSDTLNVWTLRVWVEDEDGHRGEDSVRVLRRQDPPQLRLEGPEEVSINDTIRLVAHAALPGKVFWQGPGAASATTDTLLTTAGQAAGTPSWTARWVPDHGPASAFEKWTVRVVADSPVLSVSADTVVEWGMPLEVHVRAKQVYGKVVAWSGDGADSLFAGSTSDSSAEFAVFWQHAGLQTFQVHAEDDDGQETTIATKVHVLPRPAHVDFAGDTSLTPGDTARLRWVIEDADGSIDSMRLRLPGSVLRVEPQGIFDWPVTGLGRQNVFLEVWKNDRPTSYAVQVRIFEDPPWLEMSADPLPVRQGDTIRPVWDAGDGMGRVVKTRWSLSTAMGETLWTDSCSVCSSAKIVADSAGSLHLKIQVTDDDGFSTQSIRTVFVQASPGSIHLRGDLAGTIHDTLHWIAEGANFQLEDPRYQVSWDLAGTGIWDTTGQTAQIQNAVFATVGDRNVRVQVRDRVTGRSSQDSLRVHIVLDPPWVKAAPLALVHEGQVVALGADARDSAGRVARVDWDLDADGVFETPASLDGSAHHSWAKGGTYTLVVRALDDDGNASYDTCRAIVDPAPWIHAMHFAPDTIHVGTMVRLEVQAEDVGEGIALYEWDDDNDGVWDQSNAYVGVGWTVYSTPGPKTVLVRVTDGAGNAALARQELVVLP